MASGLPSMPSPTASPLRWRDAVLPLIEDLMADEKKPTNSPKQGDKNVSDLPNKSVPSKKAEEVKGGMPPERFKRP